MLRQHEKSNESDFVRGACDSGAQASAKERCEVLVARRTFTASPNAHSLGLSLVRNLGHGSLTPNLGSSPRHGSVTPSHGSATPSTCMGLDVPPSPSPTPSEGHQQKPTVFSTMSVKSGKLKSAGARGDRKRTQPSLGTMLAGSPSASGLAGMPTSLQAMPGSPPGPRAQHDWDIGSAVCHGLARKGRASGDGAMEDEEESPPQTRSAKYLSGNPTAAPSSALLAVGGGVSSGGSPSGSASPAGTCHAGIRGAPEIGDGKESGSPDGSPSGCASPGGLPVEGSPSRAPRPRLGLPLRKGVPGTSEIGGEKAKSVGAPQQDSSRRQRKTDRSLGTRVGGNKFRPPSRSESENSTPNISPRSSKYVAAEQQGPEDRNDSITSSICSNRPSATTCYVNFDKFDLQIDNRLQQAQLRSWDQLLCEGQSPVHAEEVGQNLIQAIDWYGWKAPTKFQAVAIPCINQACKNAASNKSYTLLQARSGIGKTSAIALGLLTSVDREDPSLQFVFVATSACEDVKKYINTLGSLCPLKVAFFPEDESPDSLEADVLEAAGAQVIAGHPRRVYDVLAAARERLALGAVEALFLDDASALIEGQWVQKICEINGLLSAVVRRPLRYVVVSTFVEADAKPALRALKSSLMSKKNMFDISAQMDRIRKTVKHYIVKAKPEDWFASLQSLRKMIFIPRAVIFCDDEDRFQALKGEFEKVLLENKRDRAKQSRFGDDPNAMPGCIMDPRSQTPEQRAKTFQAFINGQYDFLLTRSEPNMFQSSLPRVFWVLHFGVDTKNLDWYGARLMCLDTALRQKTAKKPQQDGVSLLFIPEEDEATVPQLQKTFKIKFDAVPLAGL